MKAIVGLGNPGRNYVSTRHNVGFEVVDALARGPGGSRFTDRFSAQVADMMVESEKLVLAKPETFMNLSGRSVRQLVDFYQLPPESVLVICDDVNLPLGKIRFRAKGTHGGHNGLRDIQSHLGTTEYPRLRVGVGAAEPGEMVDHVLGRFRPSERPIIEEAIGLAVQAVVVWAMQGIAVCMNQYNG